MAITDIAEAAAGKYCASGNTCVCGSACNGGGEPGYNTIDSCADGVQTSFEFVQDINVTSLLFQEFMGGNVIQIDATINCDVDGDEVSFVYHNGTAWKSFYSFVCNEDNYVHFYQNMTLNNIQGNHTIRVTIAYAGTSNMVCAFNSDQVYSDTDDVKFFVYAAGADTAAPNVTGISPLEEEYLYSEGMVVNISAGVADNIGISNVTANVTWGVKSHIVPLASADGYNFTGNFTNTSDIAMYDFRILAYDTSGNLNGTVSSYFVINTTPNITFIYPLDEELHPYLDSYIEYQIERTDVEIDSSYLDRDQGEYTISGSNKYLGYGDAQDSYELDLAYSNLSQSFYVSQDMYVKQLSIMVQMNGTGSSGSVLEIREDDAGFPSSTILAYADFADSSIDGTASLVDFFLNQTIFLSAGQSYWIYLNTAGSGEDFYTFGSVIDTFPSGNYSNNASKDLLFLVFDKYRFNATFTPENDLHSFQAFAETDLGQIKSSVITAYYDSEPPVINDYTITPSDAFSLDPNVTINFTVDAEDNLELFNVTLESLIENAPDWESRAFQYISGQYVANITINTSANVTFIIIATDTSMQETETDSETYEFVFEHSWEILPGEFNATGAIIGTNTTVGNLDLISHSDTNLTLLLQPVSNRSVYFDGEESMSVNIGPNGNMTVAVTATGALSTRTDMVFLNITASEIDASPESSLTNFTLVSYLSGPYLLVDIVEYDPSVIAGDHIGVMKAKITNVGNETAENLTATWVLPGGWISRNSLTQNFSTLAPGGIEALFFSISADVPSSAVDSEESILIVVNSSGGYDDSDSRSVIVAAQDQGDGDGGGSGSGDNSGTPYASGTGGAPPEKDDLYIGLLELNLSRNKTQTFSIIISNNISSRTYYNMTFEIDGLFKSFYRFVPESISELKKGESAELNISFSLPDYYNEGRTELSIIAVADNSDKIMKRFGIIVFDDTSSLISCLNDSISLLIELEADGVDTTTLRRDYDLAAEGYTNGNFQIARKYCSGLSEFYGSYNTYKIQLSLLQQKADKLGKEGYDVAKMNEFLKLISDALARADLTTSKGLIDDANLLVYTKTENDKPFNLRLMEFLTQNKEVLLIFLISIPLLSIIGIRLYKLSSLNERIKRLKTEKELILALMRQAQEEYFNQHLISEPVYKAYETNYRKRAGEIEVMLVKLRLASKTHSFQLSGVNSLMVQKDELLFLLKSLQEDYFEKRTIDQKSFEQLENIYQSALARIEEQLSYGKKEGKR
ncbi:MAG: hypothetical protein HGA85_05660 [Nanoarchaeota archaeon]|nr:hypothetical protein [Nanoarchaeota archaeon]